MPAPVSAYGKRTLQALQAAPQQIGKAGHGILTGGDDLIAVQRHVVDAGGQGFVTMLRGMLEYGGSIWNGEAYEAVPSQGLHCAGLLRKVMPVARSFARSGFLTHEIDPDYGRVLYGG